MPAKPQIIADPQTNRGTAFTVEERKRFGLMGRLPAAVETLEQQAARAYKQVCRLGDDLDKYIYLEQLHDRNETLYYKVIIDHIAELLPVIYDPTIGEAIKKWSADYRRSRAVYLSVDRVEDVRPTFEGLGLGPDDVDLLVVSDAEQILGVNEYLSVTSELYPRALLHFEDFGASNARRILVNNRDKYRIFNDDMQGTGAIVISAVIAGMKTNGTTFADQRLLVYGAGTAGTGMADQIHAGMVRAGLTPEQAKDRIWLIDRAGLVTDDMEGLPDYQAAYARSASEVADWERKDGAIGLLETVRRVRPTILIGTSTDHGAFTQDVIESLSEGCERPIVLPLSNPTEKIEAMPQDVIAWSKGRALVATGIPIQPFDYEGTTYHIGQGNNSLLYPGLGLGTIVSGAPHVTDAMILTAAEAVASQVTSHELGASLLPPVDHLRASSATVAVAVVRQAIADGQCDMDPGDVVEAVRRAMWQPVYRDLED